MNKKQLEVSKIANLSEFESRDKNLFYIYAHKTLDEDVTFYIGKGKGNRCGNMSTRSYWWKNIASKHGYYIEIIAIDLTEKEAFELEHDLIGNIGRRNIKTGTLVNLTDGGEGCSGKVYTEEEKEVMRKRMLLDGNYKKHGKRGDYFGKSMKGENNPNFNKKRGINLEPVVRLNLDGTNPIFYETLYQATMDNDVGRTSVWYCCIGKRHQLRGFLYFKKEDYLLGNFSITKGHTSAKQVLKIDINTLDVLKIYRSISEVETDGFCKSHVSSICRGRGKTAGGFKWSYKK